MKINANIVMPVLIISCLFVLCIGAESNAAIPQQNESEKRNALYGRWVIGLNVGDEDNPIDLPIVVELNSGKADVIQAVVLNGRERIEVGPTRLNDHQLVIEIPHYASSISMKIDGDGKPTSGVWTKKREQGQLFRVPCRVVGRLLPDWQDPSEFMGRWSVKFADSDDLAVGVFQCEENSNLVLGTFLTTTGDYRYLFGGVIDGQLQLSCFDGGHAFHFQVRKSSDGIIGDFRSGNWYQTSWTATRDDDAELPDAFRQTTWSGKAELSQLKFPGLDGKPVALDDPRFAGKCRIIEVFGSWCPNCHDAGQYLSELHQRYSDRGLSILGLAFELTGDFDSDKAQVQTFIDRNDTRYPILIAGTSDKQQATGQLQLLDRVRSYPTMIFLDRTNQVKAIYTGFSGPATGKAHERLRRQFESIIESMLNE